jgi:hypothetical protein
MVKLWWNPYDIIFHMWNFTCNFMWNRFRCEISLVICNFIWNPFICEISLVLCHFMWNPFTCEISLVIYNVIVILNSFYMWNVTCNFMWNPFTCEMSHVFSREILSHVKCHMWFHVKSFHLWNFTCDFMWNFFTCLFKFHIRSHNFTCYHMISQEITRVNSCACFEYEFLYI